MIFDINDQDFLNPQKIKIIDGIAGAGKSSKIDQFFKDHNIVYLRTTSSNALKRDALKRYPDTKSDTIAGGLFHTENGIFFKEEKEIEYTHIVIDEILQTSPRVLDFIEKNRGTKNIIITTDTCQMLTQENGKGFLERFIAYTKKDHVIYRRLTETLRPRTEETRRIYKKLYAEAEAGDSLFKHYKDLFLQEEYRNIKIADILDRGDIIITHTKQIEDYIYRTERLSMDYTRPLIPKGTIARKPPKDFKRYPILSQAQAEKTKKTNPAYLQYEQIATPTRYQGQEVKQGQNLYYVVEKNSRITNRELYTVVTRCHDIKSLIILYIEIPNNAPITTYFKKPVKKMVTLSVKGEKIPTQDIEGRLYAKQQDIEAFIKQHEAPEGCVYSPDTIFIDGEKITNLKYKREGVKPKFTARTLTEREPYFNLSYMAAVYRILEAHGIDHIAYAHYSNRQAKEDFQYEIDLHAAYPHIMAKERLPIDGAIYTERNEKRLNFFIYRGEDFTPQALITDELAAKIPEKDLEFVFSTDYVKGSDMGRFLLEKAYKSVEDKEAIKGVHYGYLQKKYLEEDFEENCYILSESYMRELFMAAVNSHLAAIMYEIYKATGEGHICVDALHCNNYVNATKILQEKYSDYDFRVTNKMSWDFIGEAPKNLDDFIKNRNKYEMKKHIEMKTYPDLKTRRENRSEYERERRHSVKMTKKDE